MYAEPKDGRSVWSSDLLAWTTSVVERMGAPRDVAADVAAVLVSADRRGIASHGTARLPQYRSLLETRVLEPAARPELVRSRPALSLFDARNGWGHHAARVAIDAAIESARAVGSATSIVRHSNHYGIAGWYSLRAAAAGMIGISLTNASPLVAPTRGREPFLGTNPIAIAAPAGRHGYLCLDMATSTIPLGRVEVAARRGEMLQPGWAIDEEGRPALTPEAAFRGSLQPLGGAEETGGYKGYGLALVVDVLSGVLSGSAYGPMVEPLFTTSHDKASDVGHLFVVIDPAAVDDEGAFEARLEHELDLIVATPTIPDAPGRVLVPGEPEAQAERLADERGVILDGSHLRDMQALSASLGLPFPEARAI